jgi:hypothetical protein
VCNHPEAIVVCRDVSSCAANAPLRAGISLPAEGRVGLP